MAIVVDQLIHHKSLALNRLGKLLPAEVVDFLEKNINTDLLEEPVFLETVFPVNSSVVGGDNTGLIINSQRLNDVRYINKFLESVSEHLDDGGCFVGCAEISQRRKERLLSKFPAPLNKIFYTFDYAVNRVWPKLPYLRGSYFAMTKGRGRVISEMEIYGRLYSCGFRLLDSFEFDGKLYFAAEKVGKPDFNQEATYGPFIKLRRVGKNGKVVKVYKMRTMSPYSEYVQEFIYERNGAGGIGTGSKFNNDPRITTLGKFMRKYWIDELPMLYNLIRGDLKIFGVRPISKHYFGLYPEDFQEYRKNFTPGLVPPVYVEIPKTLDDTVAIERRYLQAYERHPFLTDVRYLTKALYNIFIKRVRSC
ncbi:MAG: sugar transferase [Saprospiraceae bacterium]